MRLTLAIEDPAQRLRLRRLLQALAGGALHTLVVIALYWLGLFRLSLEAFVLMWVLLWAGHLSFLGYLLAGRNRGLRDPSMTLPLMLWSTTAIMVTVYFADALRPVLLLIFPASMVFGAFQLNRRQYWLAGGYAVLCYALVIALLAWRHPAVINLWYELLVFVTFVYATVAMSQLGYEISLLRNRLRRRNVELQRAVEHVETLAVTDHLTGLFNRRYIEHVLKRQKSLADRGVYHFAVALLDLDHFKQINDDTGHATGDAVLVRIGNLIAKNLRTPDYLARYGGEEFLLVMPMADRAQAQESAERVRAIIAEADCSDIADDIRVTASLGVAGYRAGESLDDLLARADRRLYRAKKEGRNRVVDSD